MRKLKYLGIVFAIGIVFALYISDFAYHLWIKDRVSIPFFVSVFVAIKAIIYVLFAPYVAFLNGVSKISLNLILVVIQTSFFIPLALYLGNYLDLGIVGILIAQIIIEIPLRISQPIQYYKIINNNATGIWNK